MAFPILTVFLTLAFVVGCTASDQPGVASGSGGAAGAAIDAGSGGQTGTGGAAGAGTGDAVPSECGWTTPVFTTMAPST
ncbi:MAG TPA: hypothetical protein VFH73_28005, partial [Polyangia bacterium]|nr:hypothetical protein [Polyangia bacterium]